MAWKDARACSPQAFLNCELAGMGIPWIVALLPSLRPSPPVDGSRKPMETMPPLALICFGPEKNSEFRPATGNFNCAFVCLNYAYLL